MRAFVLDTHAFVWLVRGRRLPRAAARAMREIDTGRVRAWIPAIVVAELALLHERGRSEVGVAELEATLARNSELRVLPLELPQVREFALLRGIRDPFDRLVVAAARVSRCPVLTADLTLAASGLVEVIWD